MAERYEVTIYSGSQTIKHICVAQDEDAAAEKIMRAYAKYEPELKRVVCLGALPKPKRRS
jgi:hypothetical protein